MKRLTICLDPGHGMSNRVRGVHDSGAVVTVNGKRLTEASIVMDWADEIRALLMAQGHKVVRTRKDALDPAPLLERAAIAREYGANLMISLHCNAADGMAHGTETFYRGPGNKHLAQRLNTAVVEALGTMDRGAKTENQSQHKRLAVLAHPQSVLIELGFLDHAQDRAKLTDESLILLACGALVDAINEHFTS